MIIFSVVLALLTFGLWGFAVIAVALLFDRLFLARRSGTRFAARWRGLWIGSLLLSGILCAGLAISGPLEGGVSTLLLQFAVISLLGWGIALLMHWPNLAALRRHDRAVSLPDIFS